MNETLGTLAQNLIGTALKEFGSSSPFILGISALRCDRLG